MTFDDSKNPKRSRHAHPEELVQHSILVPAPLWAWARSVPGGAGGLIRALLKRAKRDQEEAGIWPHGDALEVRGQVSVSTPAGAIVVTPVEKGVTIRLNEDLVLTYYFDIRRGVPVVVIPTRPVTPQEAINASSVNTDLMDQYLDILGLQADAEEE